MLSETSTATVRATLPVVGEAIGEISSVFYGRLFTAHPELLRDLFNRGNQANGTQQRALAGAVAAFASVLVQEGAAPQALLDRIAHKHASLGITRDQYPIVYTHLFAAIAEVLGEAATDDVVEAWTEVYWLMADALCAIEERLRDEAGVSGESTWREFRVVGRYTETADVLTVLARPVDGRPIPRARAGQYVSVQVALPDGARQIRQYSLTSTRTDAAQFAVKKLAGPPAGEVSGHLHQHLTEGDVVRVSAPFGDVVLDVSDRPVLLASAGIGCTPMIGMLGDLAADTSARRVVVVHGDRNESTHAFRADLEQLVAKLPDAAAHVWYEHPQEDRPAERTGLVDLGTVDIPEGTVAYLCGPTAFLESVGTQLRGRGVPAADIHYELFTPAGF